jgi:hypothetical protein
MITGHAGKSIDHTPQAARGVVTENESEKEGACAPVQGYAAIA